MAKASESRGVKVAHPKKIMETLEKSRSSALKKYNDRSMYAPFQLFIFIKVA